MTENMKRVTAKVFAGNGDSSVIGQFGSALIGTKVNTTDVETIQALPAYTIGWSSAVITNRNYPTLEEMNGVMKTMSYQTAYNMQKGVAEWDEKTTYYAGDICKAVGQGVLYVSRADNNQGHAISDVSYWSEYSGAETSIPATNYIVAMQGEASYSGNTLKLPAITGYAPNGRNIDGTIKNQSVSVSGDFALTGSGSYNVFYNDSTKNLVLANNYYKFVDETPDSNLTNDVWWNSNTNEMEYISSVLPNYVISDGVNVTSAGIVSNLGILTMSANWNVGKTPVMDLEFTTGSDVTSEQTLFSIPFAEANIKSGKLNVNLFANSYVVSYGEEIYNGTYSLANSNITYTYALSDLTVYANSTLAVGTIIYTDNAKANIYGTVSSITDTTCVITNATGEIYNGSYKLNQIDKLYTYNMGGSTYYTDNEISPNIVLYTNTDLSTVWGTVTAVTSNNVRVINGVNVGYVSQEGTGLLTSGIIIYSDVDCTQQVTVSTGNNATYLGEIVRGKIGTIIKDVVTSTKYTGTISFANDTYNVTLNSSGSNFISSRLPYNYSGTISLGGNKSFKGTYNLKNTYISGTWVWNNYIDGDVTWTVAPLLHLGEIEMLNNAITGIHIHKPIVLAQMSDLENTANLELSNTQRLSNCILSYVNPLTYVNNVTSATFTLPAGYKVLFSNGRNSKNNTVENIEKTTEEDIVATIQNTGVAGGQSKTLALQFENNALSLIMFSTHRCFVSDDTPPTEDTQIYFWNNQKDNKWYKGNNTDGWTPIYIVPVAEFVSTDTNIIVTMDIYKPQDLNSAYLNRNGDTALGTIRIKASNSEKIMLDSKFAEGYKTSTANYYEQIQFRDKNNIRRGCIEQTYTTNGNCTININTKYGSNYARLLVGYTPDGTRFTEAPTPPASNKSVQIATTEWVWANATWMPFPSTKYTNLTLNASGASYTAPATGWFMIDLVSAKSGDILNCNTNTSIYVSLYATTAKQGLKTFIPVNKGHLLFINYTSGMIKEVFRFIYALGAN